MRKWPFDVTNSLLSRSSAFFLPTRFAQVELQHRHHLADNYYSHAIRETHNNVYSFRSNTHYCEGKSLLSLFTKVCACAVKFNREIYRILFSFEI